MGAQKHEASKTPGRRQLASRGQRQLQTLQDIGTFCERMQRLAENLTTWLEGHQVAITVREMVPVVSAGAYTIPGIVLHCGRNWTGFTPQVLYSVKGGI